MARIFVTKRYETWTTSTKHNETSVSPSGISQLRGTWSHQAFLVR